MRKIEGDAKYLSNNLREKLKIWDYKGVLAVHENLEYVNESINQLDLLPDGF